MIKEEKILYLLVGAVIGFAICSYINKSQSSNGKPAFIQGGAPALTRDK